jgi:hypothetical protein
MRATLLIICLLALMPSCKSGNNSEQTVMAEDTPPGIHKVVVLEVINTSNYTYLRVKENDKENWLAVPAMKAEVGETYYHEDGMAMPKFESKELNKTFDVVYFLGGISKDPSGKSAHATETAIVEPSEYVHNHAHAELPASNTTVEGTGAAIQVEKKNVKIQAVKGGITISELFEKKDNYGGKKVKVRGQVIKFSGGIMGTNWIHIQDGSDHKGKFDLTITTANEAKVGDTITVEGRITLNKDLGYGYFFEVLMEDASIK